MDGQRQLLPLDAVRRHKDMSTYGICSHICPDDEEFAEGVPEDRRIAGNATWPGKLFAAQGIPCDATRLRSFYQALNQRD